jgi:hypothetical protein
VKEGKSKGAYKTLMPFEGEKNLISGEKLGGKLTQVTHM